jgi:hypothetical protein
MNIIKIILRFIAALIGFLIEVFMTSLETSAKEDEERHRRKARDRIVLNMNSPRSVWSKISSGEL